MKMRTRANPSAALSVMDSKARFFITVIPGLESVCHLELCEKWQTASDFFYPEVQYFKGGLELELPFEQGCRLNKKLRTSTRILFRAHSFDCPDIESFKRELQNIPWSNFYRKGEGIHISFSSRSSKLSKVKQVESVFAKVLGFKTSKAGKKVFVRLFRDRCEISIDTTGERAQFRGRGKKVGKAPLRDSTAAALVRTLTQGLREESVLIDPMMGSGTFLLEALLAQKTLQRKFAFEDFPILQKEPKEDSSGRTWKPLFSKVYGFDRDPQMLEVVKHNFSSFSSEKYQLDSQDLFSQDSFSAPEKNRCVIFNPPWGKRLKKTTPSAGDWFSAIERKFKPQRIGLLVPTPFSIPPVGWDVTRDLYFENSGILNRFLVFMKP